MGSALTRYRGSRGVIAKPEAGYSRVLLLSGWKPALAEARKLQRAFGDSHPTSETRAPMRLRVVQQPMAARAKCVGEPLHGSGSGWSLFCTFALPL